MNIYIVAHTSGTYMYPASKKIFKTEKAVINEYKKLHNQGIRENLSILKAQWIEVNFEDYTKVKEDN